MILTLGDVMSQATKLAHGRGDYTPSEASFWANVAQQEVSQFAGHIPKEALAMSSTTSGEGRYSLPADYDYAIAVTLYQGSNSTNTLSRSTIAMPLIAREAGWADDRSLPDNGVPTNYVPYSTWLELIPSPTSAYSLSMRYMSKIPTLIASTDTIRLDDRWHPAVVFKTAVHLEAIRNNTEGEAMANNRYVQYVSQIPTDQQLRQRDKRSMSLRFTGFTNRPD